MRLRPLLSAAAVVAIGASLVVAPATSAGSGRIRYVDDDGTAGAAGCNGTKAVSETIQGAVDAASPGDTILVCPGTYTEQVTITETSDLTLKSVKDWKAIVRNPIGAVPAGGGGPFIIGIYLADRISVSGFKVVHRSIPDCGSIIDQAGILFVAAKDISIRSNRIVGTGDTLSDCGLVSGIQAGYPFFGPGSAALSPAGIPSGDLTTTGLIAYNAVRDATVFGIAAMTTPPSIAGSTSAFPTKVDIRNNSIRYYHLDEASQTCDVVLPLSASERRSFRSALRGVLPSGLTSDCFGIGIYQGAGVGDDTGKGASGVISRNRVMSGPDAAITFIAGDDATTPAQLFGILVIDPKHADGASTVRENIVRRTVFGIAAFDAKGVHLLGNAVRDGLVGISVGDTEGGAQIRGNRTRGNVVGIWVSDAPLDSTSEPYYVTEGLVLKGNDATGNLDVSCDDNTVGAGTQGTANTWTGNDGEPNSSDPDGICGLIIN